MKWHFFSLTKYFPIVLFLATCCNYTNNKNESINNDTVDMRIDSLFNYPVLHDSLMAYLYLYRNDTLQESYKQLPFKRLFNIYIYLDKKKDTIIDISNYYAYRVDLKEQYGISVIGETTINEETVIVRTRGIDSFPALNISILKPSDADSANIITKNPDIIHHYFFPDQIKPDARVYRLVSKDSLLLIGRYSVAPSYDNDPSYPKEP